MNSELKGDVRTTGYQQTCCSLCLLWSTLSLMSFKIYIPFVKNLCSKFRFAKVIKAICGPDVAFDQNKFVLQLHTAKTLKTYVSTNDLRF